MPEANDIKGVPDELQAALEAERFAEAISLLQAMLDKAPSRFDLHRKLAEVASLQGNSELAAKAARLCLDASEAGWEEFAILRNVLIQAGLNEDAASIAVKFLPQMPENPRLLKDTLQALAKDKRYSELAALSDELPASNFESPFLLYHLAIGFQMQGNIARAETIAQQLLSEFPERPAYVKLAADLQEVTTRGTTKQKQRGGKKQKLDRNDVRELVKQAEILVKSGRAKEAFEELESVFLAGSRGLGLLYALVESAIAAGLQDEAEKYCKEAILIAPTAAKPHVMLADLYRSQNKLNEALASHDAALQLAPELRRSSRDRLAILEMRASGGKVIPQGPTALRKLPMSRYSRKNGRPSLLLRTRIMANVIWNLTLRDMKTRYARSPIGVAMALVEPIVHIMLLWLIMSFFLHRGRPPIGEHWIFFYATGVLPYLMVMHLGNRGSHGHRPYQRLLEVPIIKPAAVLIGAAFSEFLTAATSTFLIFSIFYFFDIFDGLNNFYSILAAFVSIWLLGVGIMFFNAGVASFFPMWSAVWTSLHRIAYFSSGIIHLAQLTPKPFRDIMVWNPLLVGIEWFRNGFFTLYNPPWLDVGYLALVVGIIIMLGVAVETLGSKIRLD